MALTSRVVQFEWEVAIAMLLGFHTYLRPNELEGLLCRQVVCARDPTDGVSVKVGLILAPTEVGRPSKTGLWDEAVVVDRAPYLKTALVGLKKRGTKPDSRLWSFDFGTVSGRMKEIALEMGLEGFGISAYSLRHGGASHDLLANIRSLVEVKRRGRWASDKSLRRYAKETKLIEVMARVPTMTIDRGVAFERRLEQSISAFMPPSVLQAARRKV